MGEDSDPRVVQSFVEEGGKVRYKVHGGIRIYTSGIHIGKE
jgi:hypothetical protein